MAQVVWLAHGMLTRSLNSVGQSLNVARHALELWKHITSRTVVWAARPGVFILPHPYHCCQITQPNSPIHTTPTARIAAMRTPHHACSHPYCTNARYVVFQVLQ